MRFWEILSAYEDTGWWKVSIEEYRDLMGCGLEYTKTGRLRMEKGKPKYIKYPNTSDMIKKTTSEPLNELKGTKFEFTMEILYSNAGRGRPKITGLQFDLIERKLKPEEKTERWSKSSEKFRKAYIRLKKYQVTDVNIVKYSSVIGSERINQLLFAWDEKNRGKNPINNPLVYCNKVFVKEGKAAIENAVNDPDKPQIIRPKPEIKKDNQNKTISENGKAISYEEYKRSKIKDAEIVEESTSVYGGSGEGEVGGFIDVTPPERAIKIKELNKILDQIHNSREKIKEIDKILKEQPSSDLYKMQRKLELEKLKKLEDKGEEIVKTVNQNRV